MTATVTGYRDPHLIDFGDGSGSIYNADEDWLYPPRNVLTLASQGYWIDPGLFLMEAPSHHDRCQVRPVEQHLRHVLARSAAHGATERRAACDGSAEGRGCRPGRPVPGP
jgi:hypothetical protein